MGVAFFFFEASVPVWTRIQFGIGLLPLMKIIRGIIVSLIPHPPNTNTQTTLHFKHV
jgi:hypothetical protein